MARLEEDDVQRIVDAVVSELDRRKQIDDLANAIIHKQAEMNKKLVQAPNNYQQRQPAGTTPSQNSKQVVQGTRSQTHGK